MTRMILLLTLASCIYPSYPGEHVVQLSDESFAQHWSQLERRWPLQGTWYLEHPLPLLESIRAQVTFYEFTSDDASTCYYRRNGKKLFIGDDKWNSGCVAHELGHAVCDITYSRPLECRDFEHLKESK